MKRLLTLLLTAILALSSATLIACGNSGGGDKYSSRPNKVTLAYAYGGYGTEYWDVLAKDFMDMGINLYIGYGLTECAPLVACNNDKVMLPDSIGTPMPGAEVAAVDISDGALRVAST